MKLQNGNEWKWQNYDYSKQVSDKQLVEAEIDIFDSSKKSETSIIFTHPHNFF